VVVRAYDAWDKAAGTVRDLTYIVDKSGKIVWCGSSDQASPSQLADAFRDVAR